MDDFNFHRPASVDDALAALRSASDGKLLAGGQSLLPVMRLDLAQPSDLVSLGAIGELSGVEVAGESLVVGAMTSHAEVASSALVLEHLGALAALAGGIGDPQVRNRGTLGGSVAHADPAADYPAAVVALDAVVVTDRREIGADDFFTGLFETALEADEIVTAVRFPLPRRAGWAKFPSPASRYAVVGVFVAETGGGVRVAVTGAGDSVFRASEMEAALAADFSPSALDGIEVDAAELRSDMDASAEFRAHLIGVMARRAVGAAS